MDGLSPVGIYQLDQSSYTILTRYYKAALGKQFLL
jgi:hypothetical protein